MRRKYINIVLLIIALLIWAPAGVWADDLPPDEGTQAVDPNNIKPEGTESAPWSQYLGEQTPPSPAPTPAPKTTKSKPKPQPTPPKDTSTINPGLVLADNQAKPTEPSELDQQITQSQQSNSDAVKIASLFALLLVLGTLLGIIFYLRHRP